METKFDKSSDSFPSKDELRFFSHCFVSPLYSGALKAEQDFSERQMRLGYALYLESDWVDEVRATREAFGELMRTNADDITILRNASEGVNIIANGYPFEPGDEIISYVHEYPANHYPWRLQERERGAVLKLLGDDSGEDQLFTWSFEELERLTTERTKVIALSHVQFTSGYAADLKRLASFASERGIDLIIDAAQSLGVMEVHPEELGISGVVSSGWKWLLGPLGTGVLYTSPALREKLSDTMVGADTMKQGTDYLNHTWDPVESGHRFQFSTSPRGIVSGLGVAVRELHLKYGIEAIKNEVFRLQDLFLEALVQDRYAPVIFEGVHRSGILSLKTDLDPNRVALKCRNQKVIVTARGGFVRLAPHFYNGDEELLEAAKIMSDLVL